MSNQRWIGYDYKSTSNLVLNQDRSLRNAGGGPTGEPETLAGRLTGKFGDRTQTTSAPKELKEKIKKRKQSEREDEDDMQHVVKKSKKEHIDVLNSDLLEGISYRPKTKETKQAYEVLLNFILQSLSDQPENVIMSAADEVLAVLKDESIPPAERQGRCEEILGPLSSERFSDLIKISNAIKDYNDENVLTGAAGDVNIAVVFGEGEDEDNEYVEEVPEGDDDDDDDGQEEARDVEMKDDEEEEVSDSDRLKQRNNTDSSVDKFELDPKQVDAYWLQRELNKFYSDSVQTQKLAEDVLNALQKQDVRECENELVELLEVERFDFIRLLVRNRWTIVYCTRLGQAQNPEERRKIENEMSQDPKLVAILENLQIKKGDKSTNFQRNVQKDTAAYSKQTDNKPTGSTSAELFSPEHRPPKMLDLDSLTFQQGSHVMSNKKVKLPPNSFRQAKKGYEEVHIPAMKPPAFGEDEQLVKISSMPEWSHAAFEGMSTLNRIQSRVYKGVFEGHDNVLLCAPTGAGKTNVAMLAMMHEIGLNMDKKTRRVDLDAFKIVYIAPMKSLVQEMVHNFGNRLKEYGITVRELTGDQNLTKQQISETQVIVTTPEKWDIITRKSGDRTYTQLVRLIIIDEIHLLHDERGPVLESIVARTIRQIESTQEMVRLVGLSATLPNYQDVAAFLRVKPEHLYAFNNSFRPIPLQQAFIGITVKAPLKRYQLMNEITYEKVVEQAGVSQILVFVHSRKETAKTARALRDMAMANDQLGKFLPEDIAFREVLLSESKEAKDPDLQDLLPHGFAIHHAGMKREDRTLVEDLFRDKYVQVLVSTATLAWGVNLPARTVIIKGTQIYNAEKGRWTELSPMDILQMLGRAGRPQYDKQGEGLVITSQVELQYYLSLLNQQLPIESQFISRLPDMLNAEIVLGTIQNVRDAVNWLGYTYLYVCMLRNPGFYGISQDQYEADRLLEQRRYDLVHTAATLLAKNNLIKYDRKSGAFQTTDLGRVASHYYITYKSMNTYNEYLRPTTGDIELLKIFSLSGEFQFVAVRPAERLELEKLLERVPIPVKENIEEPTAKINVLLQAYISRLKLDGFSLASDMVYVTQSASRIMRCMFEIALKRGWAQVAERCLSFCKMIDRRMWSTQSPLRQFKKIPEEITKKLEKKDFNLDRLYELNSQQIGELIRYPALGKTIYAHVHQFPRLQLEAQIQPITRTLLRVELEITPDFEYVEDYHQNALSFWIIVEDIDGENILHSEMFVLKQNFADQQHYLSFTVPISDNPLPPQYFIKAISDRWIGAETALPISFRKLILPEKYPPHTELLDLQPLPVAALKEPSFEALYSDKFKFFNPIQTQVFPALYNGDLNALVCAPTSSGKTICAEFAILHELSKPTPGKIVYVAPSKELVQDVFTEWNTKFEKLEKSVAVLTGDSAVDLKLLDRSDIIMCTPENWDQMSRRWKQRKQVQNVKLFIIDELHLIGSVQSGPTMEVIVSRMRYISQQLKMNAQGQQPEKGKKNEHPIRIVGLASSLANATDLGEWIGATPQSLFNFHPNVRPIPLEIHIQGFDNPNYTARMLSMTRPLLYAVSTHAADKPTIIFVPTRKLSREVTRDLVTHCHADENPKKYLHCSEEDLKPFLKVINSRALREALSFGVAYLNESLTPQERDVIAHLFKSGAIQVVVITHSMTWHVNTWSAYLVIIMGTQFYEGKEHRYADYPISDVLQMIGRAGRASVDEGGKCMLFCHTPKKEFYKKFIYEPLPIESQLHLFLHDHFNAEIVTKTIENKQDAVDYITWTFFYRRLTQNPNYYKLTGITRRHLSDYLSELVEDTLKDLEQSKCIVVEENDIVAPLNLGMIAAYYYVQYTSIELFNFSITAKTKMKGLIEILSNATEYERLPIRHKEPKELQKMANHLPVKINKPDYHSAATKANVLLQSYFSRKQLSTDLEQDEQQVVVEAPRLLQSMVDVISSNGSLTPALAAMELSQMITQAVWDSDSVFKQLPHFTDDMIDRLKKEAHDVETIFDFVDMDDSLRKKILASLSAKQVQDVVRVCNRYPNIDMAYQLMDEDNVQAGSSVTVAVQLEREIEEGKEVSPVPSLYFPKEKQEGWWVLVGDPKSNQLLAIKKVTLQRVSKVKLEFTAPDPGDYNYTVYLMSDSWIGCDQEYELKVNVKAAGEDEMRD